LITVGDHPKIGWGLVGVGIALATVGALVSAIYSSYLQSCLLNRTPCPNYSTWIDNWLFVFGMGVVILVFGILESWMSKGEKKLVASA
jgi:hypothetical protein